MEIHEDKFYIRVTSLDYIFLGHLETEIIVVMFRGHLVKAV